MFSSRTFMAADLTFKFLIDFELIFVCDVRQYFYVWSKLFYSKPCGRDIRTDKQEKGTTKYPVYIDPWIYGSIINWMGDDSLFARVCLQHCNAGSPSHQLYL